MTNTETLILCDNCHKPVRESGTDECAVRRYVHEGQGMIGCRMDVGKVQSRYTADRIASVNGSPLVPVRT